MITTMNEKRALRSAARIAMVAVLAGLLAAGVKAEDGISKTVVTLGQSLAMTGPGATLALPFAQGARL